MTVSAESLNGEPLSNPKIYVVGSRVCRGQRVCFFWPHDKLIHKLIQYNKCMKISLFQQSWGISKKKMDLNGFDKLRNYQILQFDKKLRPTSHFRVEGRIGQGTWGDFRSHNWAPWARLSQPANIRPRKIADELNSSYENVQRLSILFDTIVCINMSLIVW